MTSLIADCKAVILLICIKFQKESPLSFVHLNTLQGSVHFLEILNLYTLICLKLSNAFFSFSFLWEICSFHY